MLILATEKRQSGYAYAALLHVTWRDDGFTLILQRHPTAGHLWQTSFHQTPARIDRESFTTPLWRSRCTAYATQAINALLEHVAPLGLPDDLLPLVFNLLPQVSGEPVLPNPL